MDLTQSVAMAVFIVFGLVAQHFAAEGPHRSIFVWMLWVAVECFNFLRTTVSNLWAEIRPVDDGTQGFGGTGFRIKETWSARQARKRKEMLDALLTQQQLEASKASARWAMWAAVIALVALVVACWPWVERLLKRGG